MFRILISLLIFCGTTLARDEPGRDEFYYDVFPEDFQWGFATAAYQIEGAWNFSDKGENIWDTFTHRQDTIIKDSSSGDTACNSFDLFRDDIDALKSLGSNFYRFSISWSRILPEGKIGVVSQTGIDYYNQLIDGLLANGIEPYVTLYHWDLPQALMDIGGWRNEEIALHYADYARLAFQTFGDRVKKWITFNEVYVFCHHGYGNGDHAPGFTDMAEGPYECGHNVIKAHGLAYRIYDNEFRQEQNGQVGITLDLNWREPADRNNASDVAAAHRALKFHHGWFANPLLRGEYPPIMRELIDAKSAAEGLPQSRLPSFDEAWTAVIKGTVDFLGINHYTTSLATTAFGGPPGHDGDSDVLLFNDPEWPPSAAEWLQVVPWGIRRVLVWCAMEYGNLPTYVTESGFSDYDYDGVDDADRVNYYKLYINEMLKAVKIDNVNLKGYTAWSLIDNFEWGYGYTQRFGVHYIDFVNGNMTRVPKDSARYLTQVIRDNGFPQP